MRERGNAMDRQGLRGGALLGCPVCQLLAATQGRPFLSLLPLDLGASGMAPGPAQVSLLSFGARGCHNRHITLPRWRQISPSGGCCPAGAPGTFSTPVKGILWPPLTDGPFK